MDDIFYQCVREWCQPLRLRLLKDAVPNHLAIARLGKPTVGCRELLQKVSLSSENSKQIAIIAASLGDVELVSQLTSLVYLLILFL